MGAAAELTTGKSADDSGYESTEIVDENVIVNKKSDGERILHLSGKPERQFHGEIYTQNFHHTHLMSNGSCGAQDDVVDDDDAE